MANAAVFLSDIHLGIRGPLEDFDSDDAFEQLLNAKLAHEFPDDAFDLVLLGDTFDLWQVVPDSDLARFENGRLVRDLGALQLMLESAGEQGKLRQAVQRNARFFRALATFLRGSPNRNVVFLPGNHDHSLVAPDVQHALTTLLAGFVIEARQLIVDRWYYEKPDLQVYAEHGNQFDGDNRYRDFPRLPQGEATYQDECKGYFFVRLFWNLLESLDHAVEHGPTRWYRIFAWLVRNRRWRLIPAALELFYDYTVYPQPFERISLLGQIADLRALAREGETQQRLLMVPEKLFTPDVLKPEAVFSDTEAVEEVYRKLYHQPGEAGQAMRQTVDMLLARKAPARHMRSRVPPPKDPTRPLERDVQELRDLEHLLITPPGVTPGVTRGLLTREVDEAAAETLLTPGDRSSLKGEPLDPRIRSIVFGHSHRAVKKPLSRGGMYWNTGTWQSWEDEQGRKHKDLTYVLVHDKTSGGGIEADLHHVVTS
jgi:UDP-2,3-diacylglucosamine pyrophosphatase LpxH